MLLETKLRIPQTRPLLVQRPQLIARLDAGLNGRLTLISAPAGYGKTTLLSTWAQTMPAVAWLTLEESDNDLARFLTYLVAALQPIVPALAFPRPPASGETVITQIINALATLDNSFILILDDYHLLHTSAIHDALTFLLDHQPSQMHLVIATRADPPLPLARLRGRGQLAELRQQDLQLTPAEAAHFLNQVMGLDLSAEFVAALNRRAEGWIAGLQMAAVSLRDRRDPADVEHFIHSFTGSHRYILDYLVEEVLQRQPPHVQRFLMHTAVLDRLCGPLCDALLQCADQQPIAPDPAPRPAPPSQYILEQIEAANLFIVPLDEERRWYRYHRLFASLLRKRLRQQQPDLLPFLHHCASTWYVENGFIAEAINHALAAEDFAGAARLVEQEAETALMRGENNTILGWVASLPPATVRQRPLLVLYHAWALLLNGTPIDEVKAQLSLIDAQQMQPQLVPFQAFIALFQGRFRRVAALARQALADLPQDALFLRAITNWVQGYVAEIEEDPQQVNKALAAIARRSQAAGHTMIAVMTLCHLGQRQRRRGRLHAARQHYEEALALATNRHGRRLPLAGEALMGLGELAYQQNHLEEAQQLLNDGIEAIRQWRAVAAMPGYLKLAAICEARGHFDETDQMLQEARQLAVAFDAMEWDDYIVELYQAHYWIRRGETAAARRWFASQPPPQEPQAVPPPDDEAFIRQHLYKYQQAFLARLCLAEHRYQEVHHIVQTILPLLQQSGRVVAVVEMLLLRALAYQAMGSESQALAALAEALERGQRSGCVRVFLDEGPPLAPLLYRAVERGIHAGYAAQLLAAFDVAPAEEQSPLLEPLSNREREVLQLVAEGLSNREIAARLVISLSTVKGHTSNIYGKLGVSNRTQAVARARTLGLLEG